MYHERSLRQSYIFRVPWLLLGLALGLHLPDIDSRFQLSRWLVHRSILTHGCLLSLLVFWLVRKRRGTMPALGLIFFGLTLAVAVHLCFDFFPLSWRGFALIHIPIYGWTSALFSQIWIVLSIIICLYLAFVLVRNIIELVFNIGTLIISFGIAAAESSGVYLWPFVVLLLTTTLAIFMAYRSYRVEARRA